MNSPFADLSADHSPIFVAGAIGICCLTAWLVLTLLERARACEGHQRLRWMAAVALVGGLGVWTTHFIAMLGFRPDFHFGYDTWTTVASAVIGVGLIGLPLSALALTDRRMIRAACGALAGAGVAAMHYLGMWALQGCVVSHSPATMGLSTILGIGLLATAFSIPGLGRSKSSSSLMFVLAVCAVHFTAMTGLSLDPVANSATVGVDQVSLGVSVTVVALCLFATALTAAVSSAKLEYQTHHGALLNAALTNMSNGLLLIGSSGRITLLNDRLLTLFGIDETQAAVGMTWQEYLSKLGTHLGWSAARTARVIENHSVWFGSHSTTYLEHALDDGRVISVACRPTAGGGAVLTYDDVTVERDAQKALERLAYADALTGLANRRAFQDELRKSLDRGEHLSLFLVDLDRFKTINDTLGHAAGDYLLVEVGKRLKAACGPDDLVARLGGDEMALISRNTDEEQISHLADVIVADIGEPCSIRGQTIVPSCTVGVATTADTRDVEALIQYADLALFRAKALGRGRSHRYEAGMQEAMLERRQIESDLRRAIDAKQFSLVYQPLCRIADRRIMGFEALIRWSHPKRGSVPPDLFIPIAEETGLIREIGEWALSEACCQAAGWPSDVHVAVNVSPVQLRSKAFSFLVAKTLADCRLTPSRLEIELTETALVEDGLQIAAGLESLRELGVRVAMDDFGTGYSSFAHLVDFDLDRIKIDKTFVQAAPTKSSALAVVRAVIQMARDLGVETIGEGVETVEQLEQLRSLDCDAAQGYLLGRPMSGLCALDALRAQIGDVQLIAAH